MDFSSTNGQEISYSIFGRTILLPLYLYLYSFSFGQLPSTVVYLDACICIFIIYISFFSVACWQFCFVSFLWRPRLNWDFSTIAGNKIYGHLDLQPSVARREQKYKRHILPISLLMVFVNDTNTYDWHHQDSRYIFEAKRNTSDKGFNTMYCMNGISRTLILSLLVA